MAVEVSNFLQIDQDGEVPKDVAAAAIASATSYADRSLLTAAAVTVVSSDVRFVLVVVVVVAVVTVFAAFMCA